MSSITKFGIRGLRSFGQKPQLTPISKINIYVGKNSCGKSSFLRTFPLLRQSVESDTRFPILWYAGHGGYVDFGDFDTALHDTGDSIHFDFELNLEPSFVLSRSSRNRLDSMEYFIYETAHRSIASKPYTVIASIGLEKEDLSLTTTIDFKIENSRVTLKYSGEEVKSFTYENNKFDIFERITAPLHVVKGSLIPKNVARRREFSIKGGNIQRLVSIDAIRSDALNSLTKYLGKFHHHLKQSKKIRSALELLPLSKGEQLYRELKNAFSTDKYFLKQLIENKQEILDVTFTHLFAKEISGFWGGADDLFKKFYGGVRYLGPLRASAERFYRFQDLQISEIDHTGSNLPMVINSLRDDQKESLSKWIKEYFGFELLLQASGLHYALLIREDSDAKFHNVSDMGFGYSQILPVIVSIWLELSGEWIESPRAPAWIRERNSRSIVIEQPELHLHPALQYKFGLALAKAINLAKDLDYSFIIETHSKHLVDAIGESVANNIISKNDVNITLFEKSPSGVTEISLSGYDEDGYLTNWPAGFLSA